MAVTVTAVVVCRPPAAAQPAALPTAAVALGRQFHLRRGRRDYCRRDRCQRCRPRLPGLVGGQHQRVLLSPFAERVAVPRHAARHPGPVQPGVLRRPAARHRSTRPPAERRAGRWRRSSTSCARWRTTHDIDLVLVGLGSNNSSFTFGDAASVCANRFIADAWTGWWEFWAYLGGDVPQEPCSSSDLATDAEVAAATTETTDALRAAADHSGPDRRRRPAPDRVPGLHEPTADGLRPALPRGGQPRRRPRQVPRARRGAVRGRLPGAPREPRGGAPVLPGPRQIVRSAHTTLSAEFPARTWCT